MSGLEYVHSQEAQRRRGEGALGHRRRKVTQREREKARKQMQKSGIKTGRLSSSVKFSGSGTPNGELEFAYADMWLHHKICISHLRSNVAQHAADPSYFAMVVRVLGYRIRRFSCVARTLDTGLT